MPTQSQEKTKQVIERLSCNSCKEFGYGRDWKYYGNELSHVWV